MPSESTADVEVEDESPKVGNVHGMATCVKARGRGEVFPVGY